VAFYIKVRKNDAASKPNEINRKDRKIEAKSLQSNVYQYYSSAHFALS